MSGFETRAVHVGQETDKETGAIIPPMHLSTTFLQDEPGVWRGDFDYARSGTPNRVQLEEVLASLENARFGWAFASGLAAEDAVLRLLGPNDHILIPHDIYGGTFRLIDKIHKPHGLQYTPVDFHDDAAVQAAWRPDTKMVWVETPTNPNLWITDIAKITELARSRGALSVVDNTFASPYLQNPMDLGADLVVHSVTKYISGHSDMTGGFVGLNDEELSERLRLFQKGFGAVLSPFDCYLAIRGVKTLALRIERHCDNAEIVAEFLSKHPLVDSVIYPGLSSHPQHALAGKQMKRYGGMVSFSLKGGEAKALEVASRTKLFRLAESLGAVESLINHPAKMTHLSAAGTDLAVAPSLLRLSVGIETADDLVNDLRDAIGS